MKYDRLVESNEARFFLRFYVTYGECCAQSVQSFDVRWPSEAMKRSYLAVEII